MADDEEAVVLACTSLVLDLIHKYTRFLCMYCYSGFESSDITSIIIHVTQLCCMPFALDTSDLLLINIQRYFGPLFPTNGNIHNVCSLYTVV